MVVRHNQLHIVTNHLTNMRYVGSMSSEEFYSRREAAWTNERTNGQTEKVHAPILWYERHKNNHGIKCLRIYLVCESPEWGSLYCIVYFMAMSSLRQFFKCLYQVGKVNGQIYVYVCCGYRFCIFLRFSLGAGGGGERWILELFRQYVLISFHFLCLDLIYVSRKTNILSIFILKLNNISPCYNYVIEVVHALVCFYFQTMVY